MNRSRRRPLTVAFALLIPACGDPEGDSSPAGPSLADWTETVRIGRLKEPDHEVFGNIRSAALLERGGVVILDDQGAREVQ